LQQATLDVVVSPAWFMGLYETLLGARDGYFLRLRDMAILGIGTALFLALATYFLSYRGTPAEFWNKLYRSRPAIANWGTCRCAVGMLMRTP